MVMEKQKLEQCLTAMGVKYTHGVKTGSPKSVETKGHYNMNAGWIEDEVIFNTEPDGIVITEMPQETQVCEYCDSLVDKAPIIHLQCKTNRFRTVDWKVKCRDCKKEIEYKDFKSLNKSADK